MIEFDTNSYNKNKIEHILPEAVVLTRKNSKEAFFETILSYKINEAVEVKEDKIFIESFEDRYKILKLKILK